MLRFLDFSKAVIISGRSAVCTATAATATIGTLLINEAASGGGGGTCTAAPAPATVSALLMNDATSGGGGGGSCNDNSALLAPQPPPPSFLRYLLLSRGLLIALSVPLASVATHLIVANHQRSLSTGGRRSPGSGHKKEGSVASADTADESIASGVPPQRSGNSSGFSPSRDGGMLARPLSTFGIHLGFLDPCFMLASSFHARAADLVTSAMVVKGICLPLGCYYFFRVLMSRVGLKVRILRMTPTQP